jgi:hypothetical protein
MASTVVVAAVNGGHWEVTVNPGVAGKTNVKPRYRNVSPDGRSLATYQADCQAAATALVDLVVNRTSDATLALSHMR